MTRKRAWVPRRRGPGERSLLLSLLLAGAMLAALLLWFDRQLRPVLEAMAETEVCNAVTAAVNDAVAEEIVESAVSYDDIVTIETDDSGRVTALKTNMAGANLLRGKLLDAALKEVSGLSERDYSIPLGSLLQMDLFAGRGPGVKVRALSAGTAEADYRNDFSAAGVNQTLHRVILEIRVSIRIMLPGKTLNTAVSTQVCVAETVIVGQVPDTYLQLERGG